MTVFFLLLGLLVSLAIKESAGASYKLYPYLYATKDAVTNEASFPVVDHIAPDNSKERVEAKPDFLYNPPPDTYRVVEFYVHWCGICRVSCSCVVWQESTHTFSIKALLQTLR